MKKTTYTVTKQPTVENVLRSIDGCQFIRMQTLTNARLRKTIDTPSGRQKHAHGEIQKFTDGQYLVGFRYGNSLINQAGREGKAIEFNVQDRAWGEQVEGTCLIQHKGGLYVETLPQTIYCVTYQDQWGNKLDQSEIQPLIDDKKSKRQRSSTQADLDTEVIVRDYKLESILYLAANQCKVGTFNANVEYDPAEDQINTDLAWDQYRESQNDIGAMGNLSNPFE